MSLDPKPCIVCITTSSETEAVAIAEALIADQLAAGINFFPIQSIYTWKGAVERAQEWQLLIQSDEAVFAELEATVRQIHSYEVPEIIALPIVAGHAPYLAWMATHTIGQSRPSTKKQPV